MHKRGVVVEAAPAAALVVAEADLLLELLVVPLDAPAQLGLVDEVVERGVVRQGWRASIWSARLSPSGHSTRNHSSGRARSASNPDAPA